MRRPVIAGNWKMNKVRDEALQFIYAINQEIPSNEIVETVICANDVLLRDLVKRQGEDLKIGAQNMHYETSGAYTGETSPRLLETTGVSYVLIGHSERREMFNETDETVNKKLLQSFNHSLTAILCVGESLNTREENKTTEFIKNQIDKAFLNVKAENAANVIVAYEPIWAIGTGKTATPEQAEETIKSIREMLIGLYNKDVAGKIRILYGGSVTPANIATLLKEPNIDGALVGGASLDPASFLNLVEAAKNK